MLCDVSPHVSHVAHVFRPQHFGDVGVVPDDAYWALVSFERQRGAHHADGGEGHRPPRQPRGEQELRGGVQHARRDRNPKQIVPHGPDVVEADAVEGLAG
eukprot:CAMPEP_0198222504 /NCGR_PEP_ID=MMETSP1445-20131203/88380_1 /TAXON_ID=36898 /ORGANISM="Pyramimonas sp., Strain CCMP2087" /LENGTH=99 /DNA_ID=CAMNT_0043901027 /DNA_START=51 /DNA_END=350 /DNA_ORIENTATION=-